MSVVVEEKEPEIVTHGVVTFVGEGGVTSLQWHSDMWDDTLEIDAEVFSTKSMGKASCKIEVPSDFLNQAGKELYLHGKRPKVRLTVEIEY